MDNKLGQYYELDTKKMPRHVAMIMDGNRRWAEEKGKSATKGHQAGAQNLKDLVDHAEKLGIKYMTVYALSTENWRKRAKKEVKGIFDLLVNIVKEKKEEYKKRGIKFFVLGNFQAFPLRVRDAIKEMLNIVKKHEVMRFNVALNYGGRDEIIRAIKEMIKDGVKAKDVDEQLVNDYLDTKDQPDPDLIIRTGGELRLSNFLLWQTSYAELYFTDTLWPEFGPEQLEKAIYDFQQRKRRFGGQ
jgi:undecaprenyl diphosphate synthase